MGQLRFPESALARILIMPDGTRVLGCTDYLLKTDIVRVLIDHKANPHGSEGDAELAVTLGPQLAACARDILAATEQPVVESCLHQPVTDRAVRVVGRRSHD